MTCLSDKHRVRPPHWESLATGIHKTFPVDANVRSQHWWKSKIGLHPLRQQEPMIEIVQVNLGDPYCNARIHLQTSEEVRSRQHDWIGLDKGRISRTCIDDETQGVGILQNG